MPQPKFNSKHQRLSNNATPHREAMGRNQHFQAQRTRSSSEEFNPKLFTTILKNGELSIPVQEIHDAKARADVVRMLLLINDLVNKPEFSALKAYLALLHTTLRKHPEAVARVRITVKGRRSRNDAEGHYNITDKEVVLNAGYRTRKGRYVLRSAQEFLSLMVHEYTHVLDFVTRGLGPMTRTRAGAQVAYTQYINGGEGLEHLSMRKLLNAMVSRKIGGHYGYSASLTFSEIMARFSELGTGYGTTLGLAYNLYLFAAESVKQQQGFQVQDEDEDEEALAARAEEMLQRLGTTIDEIVLAIFQDVVMPFCRAVNSKACSDYFMEILMVKLPTGKTLSQQGMLMMHAQMQLLMGA
ncbi:hypothetical protein JYJ95_02770 [Corallococcus exiguus]|uniref:hypothetical protein n=1 Tax=Corallococcus exiguus TaxID=83462 RepID=UPI001A8C1B24|nr:hypothetical protein [Corallococcus exiguus]MBN8465416.1 hypothetical protein [Corallococcus exiguus]